jgi:hypothetical protein
MADAASRATVFDELARKLRTEFPKWTDEMVYQRAAQEAREKIPSFDDNARFLNLLNDLSPFSSWTAKIAKDQYRMVMEAFGHVNLPPGFTDPEAEKAERWRALRKALGYHVDEPPVSKEAKMMADDIKKRARKTLLGNLLLFSLIPGAIST